MTLDIQLKILLISFLFGIYFSLFININYKMIYEVKKIWKILFTFITIFINIVIYFIMLMKINNGIIHIYGILMIVLGVYLEHLIQKAIEKYKKK